MQIGAYTIDTPIALAPMAGITDKPFRRLCRAFGAGWAVGEMLHSDPAFRNTAKTLHRSDFCGEEGVAAVQIAGSDPRQMAEAAVYNVALGAQLIDINMGCPAKKVCNVQAGSAFPLPSKPAWAGTTTIKTSSPSLASPKSPASPPSPSTAARAPRCTGAKRVTN